MVKSDGKLTSVNFDQTGKIRLRQTDAQTENTQKQKPAYLAGSVAV